MFSDNYSWHKNEDKKWYSTLIKISVLARGFLFVLKALIAILPNTYQVNIFVIYDN